MYTAMNLYDGVCKLLHSAVSLSLHLFLFCFELWHRLGAGRCSFRQIDFSLEEVIPAEKLLTFFFLGFWIIASPSEQKALDTCSILLIGRKGYSENGRTDEMSPSFRERCLHVKKPEVIIQLDVWAPAAFISFYFIFYSFSRGTLTTAASKLLTE